jgi:hypothetical protein
MSINKIVFSTVLSIAFAFPAFTHAAEGQWTFKVTNKATSKITKLEVSEDKSKWGNFDIGSGIAPGKTMTLAWDSSTDNQACTQWIRAKFSDGGFSEPSKQDFCENLDDPIEFTD